MNSKNKKFDFSLTWTVLLVLPFLVLVYGACSTPEKNPRPEPKPKKTMPQKGTAVLTGYADNGFLLVRYEGEQTPDRNVAVRPIGIYAPAAAPLANPTLWDGIEDRPATRACLKEMIKRKRKPFFDKLQDTRVTVGLPAEKKLRKDEGRDFWRAHVYYENEDGKQVNLAEELIRYGLNTVNEYTRFQSIKESLELIQEESKKANSGCWSCMDPPERFKEEEKEEAQLAEKRSRVDEQAEKEETKQKEEVDSKQKQSETANKEEEKEGVEAEQSETKKREGVTGKMSGRQETIEKEISVEEEKEEQASSSGTSPLAKKSREKTSTREGQQSSTKRKPSKKIEGREVEKKETGKEEAKSSSEETSIYAKGPSMNNYPGSPKKVDITKVMANEREAHFKIDFRGKSNRQNCGWFMFRVDNAGGKKVRIDLTNIGRYDKWKTLNPVYAEIPNLSDPKYFVSKKPANGYEYIEARNGTSVPNTDGLQYWQHITNVETKDSTNSLFLRERFSKDRVYIAMRYPYTSELHRNYMELFEGKRNAKVHKVGTSENGEPLHVVQIGAKKNPSIVIYAKEHPDEADSSHVAIGAAKWLVSGSEKARRIRSNLTFLIIPLLDPEGSKKSMYRRITNTFDGDETAEEQPDTQKAFVGWFRKWMNKSCILKVINLHNVESSESDTNVFNGYVPPAYRKYKDIKAFHELLMDKLENSGFRVSRSVHKGAMLDRLGGFLNYGMNSYHTLYEVNSMAKRKHLTLRDLREIGKILVDANAKFLFSGSSEAKSLIRQVKQKCQERRRLVERYQVVKEMGLMELRAPVDAEEYLWSLPGFERYYKKKRRKGDDKTYQTRWLKKLYSRSKISPSNIPDPS